MNKHFAPANRMRLLLLSLIVLGLTGFATYNLILLKHWVTAQTAGQALEVTPPSQELSADPGKIITVSAKVRNQSTKTLPISVHIEDFTASGDEGQVQLSTGSPYSVVGWTKLSPQTFSLAPGEDQTVTATISVPKDAAGGRYGSFVFAVQPSTTPGQNAALVSQQIASLFLLRIAGPVNEDLILTGLQAPSFSEFGPIPMQLQFTNKGNVHVKTYGLINVRDAFGHKVADIVVPGTNVFPQASRNINATLSKTFLIGPYTATALMYYGSQNQVLTATTTFFVFPVRIAAVVVAVLVILFLLRKRLRKALRALTRG